MKKPSLFLLLFFSTVTLFAQKNRGKNFHWVSNQKIIAACVGQFHPDFVALNNMIDAEGAAANFYYGYKMVGITFSEHLNIARKGNFDASFAFGYMLHQRVPVGTNDSIVYGLKGWHLMTSIYGKDVIPGKTVALVVGPGIDWGTMKMTRTVKGDGSYFKNIFIAPMARAEMRFVFGPVSLGARGSWRYDLTDSQWRLKKGPLADLPGTKNTGWGLEFFLGWGHAWFE